MRTLRRWYLDLTDKDISKGPADGVQIGYSFVKLTCAMMWLASLAVLGIVSVVELVYALLFVSFFITAFALSWHWCSWKLYLASLGGWEDAKFFQDECSMRKTPSGTATWRSRPCH